MKIKKGLMVLAFCLFYGCNEDPNNLQIHILSSTAGVTISDATVTVFSSDGTKSSQWVEEGTLLSSTGGYCSLNVFPGYYRVSAEKEGKAASVVEGVYLDKRGKKTVPVLLANLAPDAIKEAPIIESVVVDESITVTKGSFLADFADASKIKTLTVTVKSKNPLLDTDSSVFGLGVQIDSSPTGFDRIGPSLKVKVSEFADGYYTTVSQFDLQNYIPSGGIHYLSIVAWDLGNNRAEKQLLFTVGDEKEYTVSTYRSLSLESFEFKTFNVDRNVSAFTAPTQRDYTIYAVISIVSNSTPYTGFEVYRKCADELKYTLVKKVYYDPEFVTTLPQSWEILDDSPSLRYGVEYQYRIRGILGSTATVFKEIGPIKGLPPHSLELVSPANNSICTTANPLLVFEIKGESLLQETGSLLYLFNLGLKDASGTQILSESNNSYLTFAFDHSANRAYYYDLDSEGDYYQEAIGSLTYSNGKYTIDLQKLLTRIQSFDVSYTLNEGVTYEWNILMGTHGPKYIRNYSTAEDAIISSSFNSSVENGGSSDNGAFLFTYMPQ